MIIKKKKKYEKYGFYRYWKYLMNTNIVSPKMSFPSKLFRTVNASEPFWDPAFVSDVVIEISSSSYAGVATATIFVRAIQWIRRVGDLKWKLIKISRKLCRVYYKCLQYGLVHDVKVAVIIIIQKRFSRCDKHKKKK